MIYLVLTKNYNWYYRKKEDALRKINVLTKLEINCRLYFSNDLGITFDLLRGD